MNRNYTIAEELKDLCLFYYLAKKSIQRYRNTRHKFGYEYEKEKLLYEISIHYKKEIDSLFMKLRRNCKAGEFEQLRRYYLERESYTCSKSSFYKIVERAARGYEDEIREKADTCLLF